MNWRLLLPLMGATLGMACAFGAVGVALYAHGPYQTAGLLFAAFGAAAGLVCGVLDKSWAALPAPRRERPGLAEVPGQLAPATRKR